MSTVWPLLVFSPAQAQSVWSRGWRELKQLQRNPLPKPLEILQNKQVEFGIVVHPDGSMGIATDVGSVEVSAEGLTLTIDAQQQTVVLPGEPPQPASPLLEQPNLLQLERAEFSQGQLNLTGRVERLNLLAVDGILQKLSPTGQFDLTLPITIGQTEFVIEVTTPLGKTQNYLIPLNSEP